MKNKNEFKQNPNTMIFLGKKINKKGKIHPETNIKNDCVPKARLPRHDLLPNLYTSAPGYLKKSRTKATLSGIKKQITKAYSTFRDCSRIFSMESFAVTTIAPTSAN